MSRAESYILAGIVNYYDLAYDVVCFERLNQLSHQNRQDLLFIVGRNFYRQSLILFNRKIKFKIVKSRICARTRLTGRPSQ